MENNNDDGVAKVDLRATGDAGSVTDDTVHKVNLDAPTGGNQNDEQDDEQNQSNDEASAGDSQSDVQTDESSSDSDGSDTGDVDNSNNGDSSGDNESSEDDDQEDNLLTEITGDEDHALDQVLNNMVEDLEDEPEEEAAPLYPENIEKLAEFIKETGGTIQDYIKLNVDVDSLNDNELLRKYHASLEPSLDSEEIDIIMEDLYDGDEDDLTDRELKRQVIAKKRDLGKAKKHLQGLKDKYYDEIKAGSSLTPDQKKAVDFFNRHNEAQEADLKSRTQKQQIFTDKTNKLFNDEFKGFEFKVGEKRYRYNVKDVKGTKAAQSSIENFTKRYLGDDNSLKDEKGYHKALFTAMNADAIADHFYKQGQADAIKNSAKDKKNIDMGPRKGHGKNVPSSGQIRARTVSVEKGHESGKLRFKSFKKS